ncbi:hypothetical protein N752_21180 [Desulforamulus aquiferis]|nr:FkbM family methyltransferase [Desulforamulus aquiferis]RYD03348.1 hypothetical protein N752_21180 [Desulforamulus aquiferis]
MKGVYIGNNKMLIAPVWGGKMIVPSQDLSISPNLVLSGIIEPPLTKFFIDNVKPGSTIIDVGANVGYFSVLLGYILGPTGKIYAYEANPDLFSYLIDNLSINYLHDRTDLFNVAVYSRSKEISFLLVIVIWVIALFMNMIIAIRKTIQINLKSLKSKLWILILTLVIA